jgi:hypothetical protein
MLDDPDDVDDSDSTLNRDGESFVVRDDESDGDGSPGDSMTFCGCFSGTGVEAL